MDVEKPIDDVIEALQGALCLRLAQERPADEPSSTAGSPAGWAEMHKCDPCVTFRRAGRRRCAASPERPGLRGVRAVNFMNFEPEPSR